jgi:ATPase subunit of ABC transporter with duplicated ATPase domains
MVVVSHDREFLDQVGEGCVCRGGGGGGGGAGGGVVWGKKHNQNTRLSSWKRVHNEHGECHPQQAAILLATLPCHGTSMSCYTYTALAGVH